MFREKFQTIHAPEIIATGFRSRFFLFTEEKEINLILNAEISHRDMCANTIVASKSFRRYLIYISLY